MQLQSSTPPEWAQLVVEQFDVFLQDHAAAEKKASGMALSMALHYRDRTRLVSEMIELSIEELAHFRECVKLIHQRGGQLEPDQKDLYVNQLRTQIRTQKDECFMDRLIVGGIIEARGVERFGLVEQALTEPTLKHFYHRICRSEEKHTDLFIDLAEEYFPTNRVQYRLGELLDYESELLSSLPICAKLH